MLCLVATSITAQDAAFDPAADMHAEAALHELVAANVSYPAAARAAGVEGRILVTYTVNTNGYVTNLEANRLEESDFVDADIDQMVVMADAVSQPDPQLAERGNFALQAESLMVLQRIRQMTPKTYNGTPVTSSRQMVLTFVLEK